LRATGGKFRAITEKEMSTDFMLDSGAAPSGADQQIVSEDGLADLEFELSWDGPDARHIDRRRAFGVNMWRDFFPPGLDAALLGKAVGAAASLDFAPGALVEDRRPALVREIPLGSFDAAAAGLADPRPARGRFLPQGVLHKAGLAGVHSGNRRPFRVLDVGAETFVADLNHPLAGTKLRLSAKVLGARKKRAEVGGRSRDFIAELTDGPGIQARAGGAPTDFFAEGWAARAVEDDDAMFYSVPRMVVHLDRRALQTIRELYSALLPAKGAVLDLMSSVESHLPEGRSFDRVVGLGLNRQELDDNPALTERIVQDLNATPRLPFADASFDAALCAVSIEYLTQPVEVVRDVARVLKPGAPFVATFSNRWFPPKAIRVWKDMHPWERLGYVLELFLRSEAFTDLHSFSLMGDPRPADDAHIAETNLSDPVFAVWGKRKG
jgi:SAM-dependent methyltransferase